MVIKDHSIIFSKMCFSSFLWNVLSFLLEYVRHITLDMASFLLEIWKNLIFQSSIFIPIHCLNLVIYMYSMLHWNWTLCGFLLVCHSFPSLNVFLFILHLQNIIVLQLSAPGKISFQLSKLTAMFPSSEFTDICMFLNAHGNLLKCHVPIFINKLLEGRTFLLIFIFPTISNTTYLQRY